MSVDLRIHVVDTATGRFPRAWLSRTALELEDGLDGEDFVKTIEALPSQEIPDSFRSSLAFDDERNDFRLTSLYDGQRLRFVTAAAIIAAAEANPKVLAYPANRGAIGYLRAIDPETPVVLDFH